MYIYMQTWKGKAGTLPAHAILRIHVWWYVAHLNDFMVSFPI